MHASRPRSPRRRRRAGLLFALALVAPVACTAAACSDLQGVDVSAACTVNSDCTPPLVCAFQVCHEQCTTTRDCPSPERCVKGDGTGNVCQALSCSYNSQCPAPEVCAADGQCRDQCATARDCVSGQECVEGVCADPGDLNDAGVLPSSGDAATGVSCELSSDCGDAGLVCRNGACQIQCREDVDCVPPAGPGGACVANVCVPAAVADAGSDAPPGYGAPCNLPSDCMAPLVCGLHGECVYVCDADEDCAAAGACCILHACATGAACAPEDAGGDACQACTDDNDCGDPVWCDGPEVCTNGCCAPGNAAPCDSHNACVMDGCDEATHACSHTTLAAMDADGDGHLAVACGGDDCDDDDPTVYPGHPEVYDGKDNDCDGFVDDFVAEPKGTTGAQLTCNGSPCQVCAPLGGGPGGYGCALLQEETVTADFVPYGAAWAAGSAVVSNLSSGLAAPLAVASEANTLAIAAPDSDGELWLAILGKGGQLAGMSLLDAAGASAAAVTWTGGDYLVAWYEPTSGAGFFTLVDPTGVVLGAVPFPTAAVQGSPVAVAAGPLSLALLYEDASASTQPTTRLEILTADATSAVTAQFFESATPLALAGVPDGYVALVNLMLSTGVTAIHTPTSGYAFAGTQDQLPAGVPGATIQSALGASDGVGAAFLMQYPTGVWFGYLNPGLPNPFELVEVAPGATMLDIGGGPGGRLGVFYTIAGQVYGRQAGYASLSGADCAKDLDCASGVCTPQPPAGPKAYATCQ